MATIYEMMMRLGLENQASHGLLQITNQLTTVAALANRIGTAFGGWKVAIMAAGSALAATALFKGLEDVAKAGLEVNKQLENMKVAGFSAAEMQASMAAASKTSHSVLTTNLAENLKHINELTFAFGKNADAIKHLDELSKANSVLNRLRGGGKDEVWALVKALEGKGLTYNNDEFSKYLDAMTKVVSATGGRVTPEMYRSAFQYGRTATLGWNDEFIGGALGRMIQSMSRGTGGGGTGGPGNALMSAFSAVVAGRVDKTSGAVFRELGLAGAADIHGSSKSRLSNVKGRDTFIENPYEWVQQVLVPALQSHGVKMEQNALIDKLSKLFGNRTAGQIITEMVLQGRALEGADSPFEKDIRRQKGAMGAVPAYDELIKNDAALNIQAFHKQWENLMQTLGSDMMKPGGPVVTSLANITWAMGELGKFASENPDALKYLVIGMGGLAVALAALAASAVIAGAIALAPGGAVAAAMLGMVAVLSAAAALNWDKIKDFNTHLLTFIPGIGQVVGIFETVAHLPYESIAKGFDMVKNALMGLMDWFKSQGSNWFDPRNFLPKKSSFQMDDIGGKAKLMPAGFNPGTNQRQVLQPIQMVLNMDGRMMAQAMSDVLQDLYTHPTGAAAPNGWTAYRSPDANYSST